jgi:phage terminase small subunit
MASKKNSVNEKQDLFCREYVVDYNATQAAIRAGYSTKTAKQQASMMLTKLNILARVRELQADQVKRLSISADWVVLSLQETYRRCMQAEPVMGWDYTEKCMKETGEYVFDSKGAIRALELIGKHLGMFKDSQNETTDTGMMGDYLEAMKKRNKSPDA